MRYGKFWVAGAALCLTIAPEVAAAQTIAELRAQMESVRQQIAEAEAAGVDESILSVLRDNMALGEQVIREMEADEAAAAAARPEPEPDPAPAAPEPPITKRSQQVAAEVAAALENSVYLTLQPPRENAFVQLHTKFFLCGDDIYLSYSLRPVTTRRITRIRFEGVATGPDGTRYPFLDGDAQESPGHALGCGYQKVRIASLSAHEKDLTQHTFTNGQEVWSRQSMIEHMLGRFKVEGLPAPWPAGALQAGGSQSKPNAPKAGPTPAEMEAAKAAEVQKGIQLQLKENEARFAKLKAESEAKVAAQKAAEEAYQRGVREAAEAKGRFDRAQAAHQAELARVRAAEEEYRQKRAAYVAEYKRLTGREPPAE